MSNLLIVSDHIIYSYEGQNYTSATILYPDNFDITIFGRLTIATDFSKIFGMNLIPSNIKVVGYQLKRKGAIGYITSILSIIVNLIKAIRNNHLIILKMPYISSLFGYFISFIFKRNKFFYFIGFGGNNLRAKGRNFFANLLDFFAIRIVRFNKYNVFVSQELSNFYKNPQGVNLVLPELQVDKYKEIKPKIKKPKINNKIDVGYIGRFSEEKGVSELPEILRNIGDIRLNLLGDGILKERLFKNLNQAEIDFVNHGWVENGSSLFNIIKKMDFILIPSKTEGFGLVVVEANLCGVPVIASNVGGLKGVVKNGYNGYLVNTNKEFKEKIRYLSENKSELERLSISSRIFALDFLEKNDYQRKIKSFISENFNCK